MTGEQESAHQTSPIAPVPIRVNVREVVQASNIGLRKISQKNVQDRPRRQGFLYSNARHMPGREANPESLLFLTSSAKFLVKSQRIFTSIKQDTHKGHSILSAPIFDSKQTSEPEPGTCSPLASAEWQP